MLHIQTTFRTQYPSYRRKSYSARNVHATGVFGATVAIFNVHVRNVNPLSENNVSVTDKNYVQTAMPYVTGADLSQNSVHVTDIT